MCRSAGAEAYYVQCAATVSGVVKTSRLATDDDDCETRTQWCPAMQIIMRYRGDAKVD